MADRSYMTISVGYHLISSMLNHTRNNINGNKDLRLNTQQAAESGQEVLPKIVITRLRDLDYTALTCEAHTAPNDASLPQAFPTRRKRCTPVTAPLRPYTPSVAQVKQSLACIYSSYAEHSHNRYFLDALDTYESS